jgi:hypothetical protein
MQGAALLVNQSRGEVPELAGRQIHSLVAIRSFAGVEPEILIAMSRAVYRAQRLIHTDLKTATEALFRSAIPGLKPALVETILTIYQPAVPETPEVTVQGLEQAYRLFPASRTPPDLSKIDLRDYIAPEIARKAISGKS